MSQERKTDIFSIKRKTEELLSEVERNAFTLEKGEKCVRQLAEMGDRAIPFVAKRLERSKGPRSFRKILHIIELLNDQAYSNILHRYLYDGRYKSTSSRLELLATLKSYEGLSSCDHFSHLFDRPEDAFISWVKIVLEEFETREFRVVSLLEELLGSGCRGAHLIKRIAESLGATAIPLLALLADCSDREISFAAIKELGRIRDGRSIEALKDILIDSWQEDVIGEAGKALRRLSFAGHDIADKAPGKSVYLEYKVYVGAVDSMGNISACIAGMKTSGRFEVLCLLLNDGVGVVDAYGSKNMSEDDFADLIREYQEESLFPEGDLDYFVELLNNALYRSERVGMPLPVEFHYRKGLLKGKIHPLEYAPSFEPSSFEESEEEDVYLGRGAELFNRDEFSEWAILTPSAFDHADKVRILQKDGCGKSTLKEKRVLENFCRETLLPMKDELRRRLLFMAGFLSRRPDSEEAVRICLATAIRIGRCHDEEFNTVPFIYQLAKESISSSLKALDEGLDLRDFSEELEDTDL